MRNSNDLRNVREEPSGPCIACYTPTDTALTLVGSVEWAVAALIAMEVPYAEAEATIRHVFGGIPLGRRKWNFGCCATCAAKAHMEVTLSVLPEGKAYVEPIDPSANGSYPLGFAPQPNPENN